MRLYLEEVVLPDTTAHQPTKLSANGQDLGGEMLFSTRIAFSGTPSSLLPLEMGECSFAQGDDARMLATLTDPAVVTTHALPSNPNPTPTPAPAPTPSATPTPKPYPYP